MMGDGGCVDDAEVGVGIMIAGWLYFGKVLKVKHCATQVTK